MRILHALTALSVLFLSFPAFCSETYFCDSPGAVLEYERVYVGSGRLKWRHVMEIASESYEDGVRKLGYSSTFTKESGSVMYGGPVELLAGVYADGDVELDLSASLASVFHNFVGRSSVEYAPCLSRLPSDMKPGDSLKSEAFVVAVMGLKFRVTVDKRQVVKEELLTTPAGKFDCMVVSEHKIEKGPGRNRETTALTWYAKGVGMVRHDTYDKYGKLETSELLVSIKGK